VARNWPPWVLRQLLLPVARLPLVVVTRGGARFALGDDRVDDAIVRHVCHTEQRLYFPTRLPPLGAGALILDVGAHHGIYAVEALRRFPAAQLVAVEPNPESCRRLRANLALNGLTGRAEIVEAALAARAGRAFLQRSPEGSWGDHLSATDGIEVRTATITELLRGRVPALVKLNAEGAEFEVVPSMFAAEIFPAFIILMAHPDAGALPALLDAIRTAGYDVTPAHHPPRGSYFHCWRVVGERS
jgi:FkbM family methyltransferase